MEKEEAVSLRQAMEDMDLRERTSPSKNRPSVDIIGETPEDKQLYEAALNEAAELVWQHQNPGKVPQPGAPYRYKSHLRKNSYAHARTASAGLYGDDVAPTGLARDPTMLSLSSSASDSDGPGSIRGRPSFASSRNQFPAGMVASPRASFDHYAPETSPERRTSNKPYGAVSASPPIAVGGRRRSSLRRNISGEVQKPFSGDQIWEEPNGQASNSSENQTGDSNAQPLRAKPKNPLNRVQFTPDMPPVVDASPPQSAKSTVSKTEIYRNPPSQSRNPQYTTNQRAEAPRVNDSVPRKHGMEIRSEEIVQATSMRLKDRSPKLPTPSAVSNTPGRPIVSFDKDWKPPGEEATDDTPEGSRFGRGGKSNNITNQPRALPSIPTHAHRQHPSQSAPIPAISVTPDISAPSPIPPSPSRFSQPVPPSIQVDGTPIPSIVLPGEPEDDASAGPSIPVIVTPDDDTPATGNNSRRPLPTPQSGPPRGRHQPAATRPRGHWSPAPAGKAVGSRATARCHECGDPIEGRFVSLAGSSERFHPQCFTCYCCGTSLEALEISPEPDSFREARLERIRRRAAGETLPEEPGQTMAEDGDERLRFYCHLDWHELFAPRCKHCKTPIMGEHVVALGAHWHFGHFFCAECGDPFERGMTHIEKDGYAWCVSCQTKRTERRAPKCRKCKKAVIGQYIRALGGEWHDECFRCADCAGGFDDGQIFPREDRGGPGETVVLCTGCMERELKA